MTAVVVATGGTPHSRYGLAITEEKLMSFKLPDLPYSHDALAPYMSRETLEYHHDKHHLAYVNNGNNLLKGTRVGGQVARGHRQGIVRQERRPLQQCRPALQPPALLAVDEAERRRRQAARQSREEDHRRPRLGGEDEGGLHRRRRRPVRLGLVLARGGRRQDPGDQDGERRKSRWCTAASRSSAATSGSTPTTSTIATAGRTTSRRSSTIW